MGKSGGSLPDCLFVAEIRGAPSLRFEVTED